MGCGSSSAKRAQENYTALSPGSNPSHPPSPVPVPDPYSPFGSSPPTSRSVPASSSPPPYQSKQIVTEKPERASTKVPASYSPRRSTPSLAYSAAHPTTTSASPTVLLSSTGKSSSKDLSTTSVTTPPQPAKKPVAAESSSPPKRPSSFTPPAPLVPKTNPPVVPLPTEQKEITFVAPPPISTTEKEIPSMAPENNNKQQQPRLPTRKSSSIIRAAITPDSSSGMSFEELYRLKGVLGTGAFSTVREGYHKSDTNTTFAIKCVNRTKLSEEDEAALLDEVSILRELKHIHIIRLYDFFEEQKHYFLVMERMRGGELFDRIVAKAYYNEKEARDTCQIILEAVGYCHANNVAHRDLKPENLLLQSESDDSAVKIADFGFAKKVREANSLTTQCGTPGYVAPEILEGTPYDTKSDMWSVGVILYILLGGYPPFIENNQRDLFRKIRRGDYEFHEEYWGTVSVGAKDLISSLLMVDPAKRLDAKEALNNAWIREDDEDLLKKDLGVNLEEFKKFNAKRKFKAAVSTVMAVNKLQSLGKDFLKNLAD